jgi:hypothetical protein
MRWASGKVFVSKVLAGETVGLEAVADGCWRLWFSFYELGEFDERQMVIRSVRRKPIGGRCVSGQQPEVQP